MPAEYTRHVTKRDGQSWCGVAIYRHDKPFIDANHALFAVVDETRLLPCTQCLCAIRKVINDVIP